MIEFHILKLLIVFNIS